MATSTMDTTRLDRAQALVARGDIVRSGSAWLVPSMSSDAVYRVTIRNGAPRCTCPDFARRQQACKHVIAAALVAQEGQ